MARLEAALERIDHLSGLAQHGGDITEATVSRDPVSPEVLDRLDTMISRLRAAIDEA
jgi:hypothetical protein